MRKTLTISELSVFLFGLFRLDGRQQQDEAIFMHGIFSFVVFANGQKPLSCNEIITPYGFPHEVFQLC
jgi:hypothetical protein